MNNPLLDHQRLPKFSVIRGEHVEPAVDEILQQSKLEIDELLHQQNPSWSSFAEPLEEIQDRVKKTWSPVVHLNAVVNTPEIRDAYNRCLHKISDFFTELGQNSKLCDAFKAVEKTELNKAQQKSVENALRDFHLAGVDLPEEKKQRFKDIQKRLSSLKAKFAENVLDATNAWGRTVADRNLLEGIPERTLKLAEQKAQEKGLEGWHLVLDFPTYYAVMSHAKNRDLRQEFYTAWITRASDQGPNAGTWDNTAIMEEILALRLEKARLLGFETYADLSLATKMATDHSSVMNFLNDLAQRSRTKAQEEFLEVSAFAQSQDNLEALDPWDVAFYAEQQKQQKFDLSDEMLRPYFPLPKVLEGMFGIVNRLYGISVQEETYDTPWHPEVRFFHIQDPSGQTIGSFFADVFAREGKRGGAWMDDCVARKFYGDIQLPVAHLVCNFMPSVGDEPALLTHDEVLTLFHEFGHCLHHLLTQVDYPSVGGIAGVAWDAVELPSQFMENFAWEPETLPLISQHYQSGQALPDELFQKLLQGRLYQTGMQMVRQLEFALFDFELHMSRDQTDAGFILSTLLQTRDRVAVTPQAPFARFAHSFSHIFSGGYAAGYYSYKWAEVLSADAFSAFEDNGILDAATGRRFQESILEVGGTEEPMQAFINFRGREPSVDALLRHSGMS